MNAIVLLSIPVVMAIELSSAPKAVNDSLPENPGYLFNGSVYASSDGPVLAIVDSVEKPTFILSSLTDEADTKSFVTLLTGRQVPNTTLVPTGGGSFSVGWPQGFPWKMIVLYCACKSHFPGIEKPLDSKIVHVETEESSGVDLTGQGDSEEPYYNCKTFTDHRSEDCGCFQDIVYGRNQYNSSSKLTVSIPGAVLPNNRFSEIELTVSPLPPPVAASATDYESYVRNYTSLNVRRFDYKSWGLLTSSVLTDSSTLKHNSSDLFQDRSVNVTPIVSFGCKKEWSAYETLLQEIDANNGTGVNVIGVYYIRLAWKVGDVYSIRDLFVSSWETTSAFENAVSPTFREVETTTMSVADVISPPTMTVVDVVSTPSSFTIMETVTGMGNNTNHINGILLLFVLIFRM